MKKITLIACAVIAAGLLFSCNNGTKEYNEQTWANTEHSYLVSGTIKTVTEASMKEYGATNQTFGAAYTMTQTDTIKSTAGKVTFGEYETWESNWDYYSLYFNSSSDGKSKKTLDSASQWDGTKDVALTAAQLEAAAPSLGAYDEQTATINADQIEIRKIDDKLYVTSNGTLYEVTADLTKIEEGADFTVSVTFVTKDTSNDEIEKDADDKQTSREIGTEKVTKTYDLTFTAK